MSSKLYQRIQRALNLEVVSQEHGRLSLRDLLWESSWLVAEAFDRLAGSLGKRKLKHENEILNLDNQLIYRTTIRLNRSEYVRVTVTSPSLNRFRFDDCEPSRTFHFMMAAALSAVLEVNEQSRPALAPGRMTCPLCDRHVSELPGGYYCSVCRKGGSF